MSQNALSCSSTGCAVFAIGWSGSRSSAIGSGACSLLRYKGPAPDRCCRRMSWREIFCPQYWFTPTMVYCSLVRAQLVMCCVGWGAPGVSWVGRWRWFRSCSPMRPIGGWLATDTASSGHVIAVFRRRTSAGDSWIDRVGRDSMTVGYEYRAQTPNMNTEGKMLKAFHREPLTPRRPCGQYPRPRLRQTDG
jgi:hypothetical protein